jgi:ketosteroid isomerase-like protein
MHRNEIDHLIRNLYDARARGDFEGVCRSFSDDVQFRIASAGQASQVSITTNAVNETRALLRLLIKTFRLSELTVMSLIIDGSQAAAHWRANIDSRITGASVPTELVDLFEVRDGRIVSYQEFFVSK